MKRSILLILALALALAGNSTAAERTVLFEEFTNAGCPYCWSAEDAVNSFVNGHLPDGGLAVIRVHVSWPGADPIYSANPTEQNARKSFYSITGVPAFRMDGASTSSSGLEGAFTSALAEPTDLDVHVARNGDASSGTVSVRLIAEAQLPSSEPLRLFSTLVEDSVSAGGSPWPGQYFFQAFRDNLFGLAGPLVEFEGPYPDTLYFETDYEISGWDPEQLYLATFVQQYSSTGKEVINAHWSRFMDLQTGVEHVHGGEPVLHLLRNPSAGTISLSVDAVPSSGAQILVLDLAGRVVASRPAGSRVTVDVDASGVYLVVLRATRGESAVRRAVVIR